MFACAAMPQEAAEGEPNAVSQLEVARNILEEAAARVSEDLKLAEQVRAQLEEVDEIIQRLGRDREEIDRLKEETRSNISELQRMVAA
jgi:predicted Rossmann fold nucleotide-binding protein DprA/Smf involved in DNA uptake